MSSPSVATPDAAGVEVPASVPQGLDAPRRASVVEIALEVGAGLAVHFLQRMLSAPVDRVMMLSTVEGELTRQQRVPDGFGGTVKCVKRVYRKEGCRGFLRGFLTDSLMAVPSAVVDVAARNLVFHLFNRIVPQTTLENLGAAQMLFLYVGASTLSVTVTLPYTAVYKTIITNYISDIVAPVKMEKSNEAKSKKSADDDATPDDEVYLYSSAMDTAKTIYRRHGWRGFFRGAMADPLVVMVKLVTYFSIRSIFADATARHPIIATQATNLAVDLAVQPFQVVGQRLMLTASAAEDVPAYDGIIDAMTKIVKSEGYTALWSGLKFRYVVVAASIGFRTIYDTIVYSDAMDF